MILVVLSSEMFPSYWSTQFHFGPGSSLILFFWQLILSRQFFPPHSCLWLLDKTLLTLLDMMKLFIKAK